MECHYFSKIVYGMITLMKITWLAKGVQIENTGDTKVPHHIYIGLFFSLDAPAIDQVLHFKGKNL